ncbi:hypothetical protein LA080_002401 [Diaporthe eres]|nr:hypothetical protein LA080_002401 [Diaporthe eres]
MAESIPQLQRTICDLTNVLSLIMKRGPDMGYEDDKAPTSDSPHPMEQKLDLEEKEEHLDEAEFEDPKRNSDAKHVTSVIMLEEANSKSATFLCAKNEGLNAADSAFLKKLEEASRLVSIPETLTNREIQKSLHKATHKDWEDNNHLHFRPRLDATDEESTSDKAVDCLSGHNEESLTSRRRTLKSEFSLGPSQHITTNGSLPGIF